MLAAGDDGAFALNAWSFGQLCRLAGVAKGTVNRLSPDTASRAFAETPPTGSKPLQLSTAHDQLRLLYKAECRPSLLGRTAADAGRDLRGAQAVVGSPEQSGSEPWAAISSRRTDRPDGVQLCHPLFDAAGDLQADCHFLRRGRRGNVRLQSRRVQ